MDVMEPMELFSLSITMFPEVRSQTIQEIYQFRIM
ncbi:unnamed protein product [Strongylus vulgaris]|uniref:Uncharacterized protein n=1 Tax=Strongylus vulgaris TaxID=40348 RepID=A0A3P7LEG0_STRVU|nr:unnamed protein product [Strongylus vulgaris]